MEGKVKIYNHVVLKIPLWLRKI